MVILLKAIVQCGCASCSRNACVNCASHSMAPTKQCHYSAAFKRKVVLHAEKTSNLRAQQEFGVHEKNVRRWQKQCVELFGCEATGMAFTGPKTDRHYAVVADFVRERREAGIPMTTEIIQAKAREVTIAKGVLQACFKASRGWRTCFVVWIQPATTDLLVSKASK